MMRLVERRHVDFAAQCRLRDVEWDRAVQVLFAPFEKWVLFYFQENVEIARRSAIRPRLAFVRQPQPRAVIHARRNVYLQLALDLLISLAVALRARIADYLPRAATGAARAPDGQKT